MKQDHDNICCKILYSPVCIPCFFLPSDAVSFAAHENARHVQFACPKLKERVFSSTPKLDVYLNSRQQSRINKFKLVFRSAILPILWYMMIMSQVQERFYVTNLSRRTSTFKESFFKSGVPDCGMAINLGALLYSTPWHAENTKAASPG